jgi:hypothetical protein
VRRVVEDRLGVPYTRGWKAAVLRLARARWEARWLGIAPSRRRARQSLGQRGRRQERKPRARAGQEGAREGERGPWRAQRVGKGALEGAEVE